MRHFNICNATDICVKKKYNGDRFGGNAVVHWWAFAVAVRNPAAFPFWALPEQKTMRHVPPNARVTIGNDSQPGTDYANNRAAGYDSRLAISYRYLRPRVAFSLLLRGRPHTHTQGPVTSPRRSSHFGIVIQFVGLGKARAGSIPGLASPFEVH